MPLIVTGHAADRDQRHEGQAYTLQRLATRLYPAHLWQETRGRIFANWQEAYTLIHI